MKQFENIYYFFGSEKLDPDQFIKDVFMKNTETPKTETDPKVFQKIIINVDSRQKGFIYNYNKIDYEFLYSCHKVKFDETVYRVTMTLKYTNNKERAAYAFSKLINDIKRAKEDKFNMILIKDSLSIYYTKRLYSKLALYERSIRALITAIFIPAYKDTWTEKLKDSLDKDIKGNKRERLELALEELDLSDFESILFDQRLNINVENYYMVFELQKIEFLTKEELISIILENKPISLWDKQISKYATIENAEKRMQKIRDLRNKIAHNKTFTDRNYRNLKEELNYIIPKINEAEMKILKSHDRETIIQTIKHISELASSLQLPHIETINKMNNSMKQLQKNIINPAERIQNLLKGILKNEHGGEIDESINEETDDEND
ncbi:Swt1 family HEPN domain-containing protein [Gracilibacillus sp. JCM 18860]|uniref:Swt1 family HEPN domain-containing protein n=1 Tax=Gracilibacillus sp. JCM 18860 TaxID=1306159 RepID=UPI0006D0D856